MISELACKYKRARTWYGRRLDSRIDMVAIHVTGGGGTMDQLLNLFARRTGSSCNYVIGTDAKIGCCLEETISSCCTSNKPVDVRSITIEVANCVGAPDYEISDEVKEQLIKLLVDICQRYPTQIGHLRWLADKKVLWKPEKQNVMAHRWFANKACPGNYIYDHLGEICDEVNRRVDGSQPEPEPEPEPEEPEEEIKVGDIVDFTGKFQYSSSNSMIRKSARAGECKVMRIVENAKHRFLLKKVTGGTAIVNGWVDESDIKKE